MKKLTEEEKDNIYYVCCLIEFTARKTNNSRRDIVKAIKKEGIEKQLKLADINHCLSFEQVSDELIEEYNIGRGDYDTISRCEYEVPSFISIGRLYQQLILSVNGGDIADTIIKVFSSIVSDAVSNFNSSFYYSSPDYIRCCYLDNIILD